MGKPKMDHGLPLRPSTHGKTLVAKPSPPPETTLPSLSSLLGKSTPQLPILDALSLLKPLSTSSGRRMHSVTAPLLPSSRELYEHSEVQLQPQADLSEISTFKISISFSSITRSI